MVEVKHDHRRRRGYTRVSAKHQVTLPVEALREAGLGKGDVVKVEVDGRGRILLVAQRDPLAAHAGEMSGVYEAGETEDLRDEWR